MSNKLNKKELEAKKKVHEKKVVYYQKKIDKYLFVSQRFNRVCPGCFDSLETN